MEVIPVASLHLSYESSQEKSRGGVGSVGCPILATYLIYCRNLVGGRFLRCSTSMRRKRFLNYLQFIQASIQLRSRIRSKVFPKLFIVGALSPIFEVLG